MRCTHMNAVHTYECDTIHTYERNMNAIHTYGGVATISRLPKNILCTHMNAI